MTSCSKQCTHLPCRIQSCLIERALQACHVPAQHECYEEACVSHASFVTDWKPLCADVGSTPKYCSADSSNKPGSRNPGKQLSDKLKQGLPLHLQAIVSDLHGFRR